MSVDDRAYLLQVVRNVGVPQLWELDAVQDVWLYCWQHGDWRKMVINRRAIDAARKYGWRSHRGVRRDHYELGAVTHTVDPYVVVDAMLDAAAAIRRLTPNEQAALIEDISGRENVYFVRRCRARKQLRAMIA